MKNSGRFISAAAAALAALSVGLSDVSAQNTAPNAAQTTQNAAQNEAQTKETLVASQIKSLGLFKNGVVVVQEEIQVPESGTYVLPKVPMALHGTFFLESEAAVETTVTDRPIAEPLRLGETLDYQKDFAGKEVVVYLNTPESGTISGTVAALDDAKTSPTAAAASPAYGYDPYGNYRYGYAPGNPQPNGNLASKLILETENGQVILERSAILRLDVKEKIASVERSQKVMVFDVKTDKPTAIRLFYLTRGISWAPSYRIDTTDPKRLSVEQTSVLINELESFENAEVSLISGFPKIECENVYAPFVPGSTLNAFFQQLSNRSNPRQSSMMTQQAVYTSNAVMPSMPGGDVDSSAAVSGEGLDLHFQNIGLRSMRLGDRLSLSNGTAFADYERIVEWTIPDTRNGDGRYTENQNDPMNSIDPWDTLRFRNPLSFPMTTAPATITANGHFYGQNSSFWASPDEMTKIPVTKSMSVRVKAAEFEKAPQTGDSSASVQRVTIYGTTYRRAEIAVQLTIVNRRAEPVRMLVTRRFSGELTQQIPDAKVTALSDKLNYVNRSREIQWEFELGSGETKTIEFTYTTLIR